MTQRPDTARGSPGKVPVPVLSEAPLVEIDGHDEWLLDEALAESFPASDSIAVTPKPAR